MCFYIPGKFLRFSVVPVPLSRQSHRITSTVSVQLGTTKYYNESCNTLPYNTGQYDNIPREYDEVHRSRSPYLVCEHKDDFLIPLILPPVNVLTLCRPCPADSFLQEPPRIIIRAPLVILTLSRTMIRNAMIIVIE